jgi:hypothetical protein
MDKQRDVLADALYKKGLALIQLEEDQETTKVIGRFEVIKNLFIFRCSSSWSFPSSSSGTS